MAATAHLHFSSTFPSQCSSDRRHNPSLALHSSSPLFNPQNHALRLVTSDTQPTKKPLLSHAGGGNSNGGGGFSAGGGGGGDTSPSSSASFHVFGILGLFLNGWRSRVAADPQLPFKLLMEEVVGVSSCILGDMASRPNFGLNELDFVFSTLVVGSILNFTLMYLLAPTSSGATATATAVILPGIFANCPTSHMFEAGAYTLTNRLGTFAYKGTIFAAIGFVVGLAGTALSNGLIKMRKKMDPTFETSNKAPPTILNSATWALHMGINSNLRYQTLNGVEHVLAKGLPPLAFKTSVVLLRCFNNVLGGMSFVVLARLTGSQSQSATSADDKEKKLLDNDGSNGNGKSVATITSDITSDERLKGGSK